MSRGLGKIERAALAVLKEKAGASHVNSIVKYSAGCIAVAVYGADADHDHAAQIAADLHMKDVVLVRRLLGISRLTAAQRVSVRRALYALAKVGLVVCLGRGQDRETWWMETKRWQLAEAARWQMDNVTKVKTAADLEHARNDRSAAVRAGLDMQTHPPGAGE